MLSEFSNSITITFCVMYALYIENSTYLYQVNSILHRFL